MNNYQQYPQGYQQNYQQGYQQQNYQPDIQQISAQYNSIMGQMQQQMQGINERMAQIQSQFHQQYPQLFQQPPQSPIHQPQQQTQQMQTDIVGIAPVTSMDEVKAQTPSPIGKKLFTNFKQGEVSFVYFDNDGNKVIDVYTKNNNSKSNLMLQSELATVSDINYILDYMKMLEDKIGGINNDTRSNYENNTEQSSDSSDVPKVTAKPKSNARLTNNDKSEQ